MTESGGRADPSAKGVIEPGADEIDQAGSVISSVITDSRLRDAVLRQLIESADAAARIAPSAWAVTLFRDGFLLNVGQVEVFVLTGDTLRFNLIGVPGEAPFMGPLFVQPGYRSVRDVHCAFVGSLQEFAARRMDLAEGHLLFVKRAATTRSGEPRTGTPHRISHSEALMAYARAEIERGSLKQETKR